MKNLFTIIIVCFFFSILWIGAAQAAAITSAATGNWNTGSTWVGGVVPALSDDVTIAAGHTVTIDVNAACSSLIINGTLQFSELSYEHIDIAGNVTINSGGILKPAATADNYRTNWLYIQGNFEVLAGGTFTCKISGSNDGFLGLSMNGNATHISGTGLNFSGSIEINVAGSGTVTLNDPINIDGTLYLTHGTLNNTANNFTLGSNSLVYRSNSDALITAAPSSTGSFQEYHYRGTMATGLELLDAISYLHFEGAGIVVTLSKNLSTSQLYFSSGAKLNTGDYTLSLNGSISGYDNNNYIIGKLALTTFSSGSKIFPIGSTTAYRPVTVNITSLKGSGNITVSQTDADPTCNSLPVGVTKISDVRNWTITPDLTITSLTANITLSWGDDDGVTNPANMTVVHGYCSTGAWDVHDHSGSATGDASSGTITGTFSSFSDFTLGTLGADPLPVELSTFSASVNNNAVNLKWQTATEVNNYGFEVQRTIKNSKLEIQNWASVGFAKGNGNSNSTKEYSFVDKNISDGKYSYRLKQIDNDGSFKYSKEVVVEINKLAVFSLAQNYPNPFNPSTTITFSIPEDNHVILKLYDILGREVKTLINENRKAGTHTLSFNAASAGGGLSNGVYIYKIVAGKYSDVRKMLLLK